MKSPSAACSALRYTTQHPCSCLQLSRLAQVLYVSDVEGHFSYFCDFIRLTDGIDFVLPGEPLNRISSEWLELTLSPGFDLVFGGDTCDKVRSCTAPHTPRPSLHIPCTRP